MRRIAVFNCVVIMQYDLYVVIMQYDLDVLNLYICKFLFVFWL